MKVLIIEDEKIARENLVSMLKKCTENVTIESEISSVSDAVSWFNNGNNAELAFFDIQLNDGLSFEIFDYCSVNCPIVFVTSYDEYVLKSFQFHGIDYILKPLTLEKVKDTFNKYYYLKNYFSDNVKPIDYLNLAKTVKNRIIVHKGNYNIALETSKIAYIHSENKICFVVNFDGTRYLTDYNLSEMEEILDENNFFRVNRQFIVNIQAIARFKPHSKGKVLLELLPKTEEEIIISQENSSKFKNWIIG